jgi:streptogramin lyase
MMKRLSARWAWSLAALGLLWGHGRAEAGLTLTSQAQADGYKLTTFASGFPNSGAGGIGPLGIVFTNSGTVLVSSYWSSEEVTFADTDNQAYPGSKAVGGSYSYGTDGLTKGLDGTIYMANYLQGAVYALNDDGTYKATVATGLGSVDGIATDPANGHLFVSSSNGILDVNPANGDVVNWSATHGGSGYGSDGLTFSADGKTLYAAIYGNSVQGYDVASGTNVFITLVAYSDGTALGYGSLAGNIFANTNDGRFLEINLKTGAQTLLASGGSRGDFVQVDPNGTLLITQTDSILRLTPPAGGGFGNPTPEPSTLVLAGLGAAGLLGRRWRARRPAIG